MNKQSNKKRVLLVFTDCTPSKSKEKKLKALMEKSSHLMHLTKTGCEIKSVDSFSVQSENDIQVFLFPDKEKLKSTLIEKLRLLKEQYTFLGAFHNRGKETNQNIKDLYPSIIDSYQLFPRDTSQIQLIISDLTIMNDSDYKQKFPTLVKKLINEIGEKARLNKCLELLHLGFGISNIDTSNSFQNLFNNLRELYQYDRDTTQQQISTKMYVLKKKYKPENHQEWISKLRDLLLN